MTEQELTPAAFLAQLSTDDSVTTEVLTDRERQFPDGRLSGEPPVAYLDDSESPAYVLTNDRRGLGLGTKRNTVSPGSDRGTVVVVTGRRTICLVGQDGDDVAYSVPHDAVAWASYYTGLLANRIELRTPAKAYHCWVERTSDERLLQDAVEYIEQRTSDDPTPIAGDDEASVVTWRGGAVNSPSSTAAPTGSERHR